LTNNASENIRGFNTVESLKNVVKAIQEKNPAFDIIIVSGDISQTCTEESYALFVSILKPLGKPVYCIPGNHDDASLLQRFFPDTPTDTISVVEQNSSRIILVNTQLKHQQYGFISSDNLKRIIDTLESSNKIHLLALHHPPLSIGSQWMDDIGLKNGAELLKYVEGFENLKLILYGHVHQEIKTNHRHIQIFATPSTCYQFLPESENTVYDDRAPGYRLVKINDNGTIESAVYRI